MDNQKALSIIKNVASEFRGTLQDHQIIQEAIKFLEGSDDKRGKKKQD
jgi:hypothetical protein